jgi:hypothetical protein
LFGGVGAGVGFFLGMSRRVKTSATALGYSWALHSAGLGSRKAVATEAARAKVMAARLATERTGAGWTPYSVTGAR